MNHPIVSFHLLNSKEECIREAVQSAISCVEQDTPVVICTGPINSAGFLKRMIYQDRTELDMRKTEDCQAVEAFLGKIKTKKVFFNDTEKMSQENIVLDLATQVVERNIRHAIILCPDVTDWVIDMAMSLKISITVLTDISDSE